MLQVVFMYRSGYSIKDDANVDNIEITNHLPSDLEICCDPILGDYERCEESKKIVLMV